jgi:hypothetical protein
MEYKPQKKLKVGDPVEIIVRNVHVDAGEIIKIDRSAGLVRYRSWSAPEGYTSAANLSCAFPLEVS